MQKILFFVFTSACVAQVTIPDGTPLRVRLEQTLSSATAVEGQPVTLSVAENVRLGDLIVIKEGARVTGTVTNAIPKRHMGRAGQLDFSIDSVRVIDGESVAVRYADQRKFGESHAVRTGIMTAGVAAVFWPAAPVVLLMKGKDIILNKGISFEVFTGNSHTLTSGPSLRPAQRGSLLPPTADDMMPNVGTRTEAAVVSVMSTVAEAEVELDGAFVGNTPATLHIPAGKHQVVVRAGARVWQREIAIASGSNVTLNAGALVSR